MSEFLAPLKDIRPNPFQMRTEEDPVKVRELALDIHQKGLLQTPAARTMESAGDKGPGADQRFQLIFGHTRFAAYELLATKGIPELDIPPNPDQYSRFPINIRKVVDDRTMFEQALAENMKRQDLNPIEVAKALKLYIEKFKATSKQAGELFNMKAASVRSKVRLLQLPEDIQNKVIAGELAEAQARKLVTIGRVVKEKDLKDLVEEVREDGNIDHAIGQALSNASDGVGKVGTVVSMRDWSGDEKVAGHDLWKMDGSNFPQQLLSPLTVKSLPALIGRELKPAEIPVVENWLKQLGAGVHPDALINEDPATADLHDQIYHLAAPPTCAQCPFHMRNDGEDWCGWKACYDRKETAFLLQEQRKFSAKLKIPVYDPKVDGAATRKLDGDKAKHKTIFKNRHERLRLKQGQLRYGNNLGGLPSNIVVVATKGLIEDLVEKRGTATSSSSSRQTDYAEEHRQREIRNKMERRRREALERFLWQHLTPALAKQLKKFDFLPAMAGLAKGIEKPRMINIKMPAGKAAQLEHYRKLIVWECCPLNIYNLEEQKNAVTAAAKQAVGFARSWGVALPTSFTKEAEKIDAEILKLEAEENKPAKKETVKK